jgi:hypothetical protein
VKQADGTNLMDLLGCIPEAFRIGTLNRLPAVIGA